MAGMVSIASPLRAARARQFWLAASSSAVVALAGTAAAQGSKADYQRAAQLRARFAGKVLRSDVRPEWVSPTQCWYGVETGNGDREIVVVDVEAEPARRVVFTERALAGQLGIKSARVDALRWGSASDPAALRALVREHGLVEQTRIASEPALLEPDAEPAFVLPANDRVRRSGANGPRTMIWFVNRSDVELDLFWVERGGGRRQYGSIEPGDTRWMSTYASHSFVLVKPDGTDHASYTARPTTGIALLTDATALTGRSGRDPNPRQRGNLAPDGKTRAFIRDHNVWVQAVGDRSEAVRVTDDGSAGDGYAGPIAWASTGAHFYCRRIARPTKRRVHYVEAAPSDQLQPRLHAFDYVKPGDPIDHPRPCLFRFDARTTTAEEVAIDDAQFANPWSINALRWAPDGARFTFLYNQRGHRTVRWIAVDADTGEPTVLIDESPATFVDYAHKLYLHVLDGTGEAIWMSERDGHNHLWLVDAATGAIKSQITRGPWVVRGVEKVDVEAREVLFRAGGIVPGQDPYHVHWARASLDGGGDVISLLTEGDGTHTVTFSPDGAHFVDVWSRVDHAPVTELRRSADGGLVTVLERGDTTALEAAGWRAPQRFVAKGRDGETDIWGVVYRPTDHDPQRSYPVIEQIYAGPHGAHVPKSFAVHRRALEVAELGFVVVQIDGMGTNHRSKAFHDVAWQNLGDAGFPDRIAWLRALAATDSSLDLTRVGIYGGSAGGQNAMRALIAHGDFYKAAAADCGCHDNRMDKIWWNELWMSWPIGDHYIEASNVEQAHRMQGDLLLIVGERDTNVDPASTMQVVDALIRADKDFELLVIPGAGHGAAGTQYGTRRQRDFFVRKLLGREPRWE